MTNITAGYVGNVIVNLLIFILLVAVYSYILKLETSGCLCAQHPNREFIKNYSIFALIFLGLTTFIPMTTIINVFGDIIAGLFTFIKFVFYIISIVYFYMILDYTRYLINEKCKCSEDMRREFIMAGSTVEILILLLIFLVIILLPLIFNTIVFIFKNMNNYEKEVSQAIKNPYASVKKIPSNLKTASKIVSKTLSQTKKGFKGLVKPNKF